MSYAEPTYATRRSPERHTDGPAVGLAIARWLGRRPSRWQQAALDVALERVDGPSSPFAYDSVGIVVGRRCGKTVTVFGVPLARALMGPVQLPSGLRLPFKATHTAQNLTSARQRFAEDLVDPYRRRHDDATWARVADFKRAAADTTLTLDPRARNRDLAQARARGIASELRVLAPTPSSARGAGVFHLGYDEALTLTAERGRELAEAARPTMAGLHGHAQTWTVSNVSRGTDNRMHLHGLRNKGRAAVLADRRDGVCWIEYSLPPGADPDDERQWWRHYPALGDGIVGVAQLRRDREEFGPEAFAAEYLCRWPDEGATGLAGWEALDARQWMDARTELPMPTGAPWALGVDVDPFGRSSSIVAATQRDDGLGGVLELREHHPGSSWVADAVCELAPHVAAVAVDDYGPGADLLERLATRDVVADKLVPVRSAELVSACWALDAALQEGRVSWVASELADTLTAAAAAAERTPGNAWRWERRVSVSQTPLLAATLGMWGAGHAPQTVPESQVF